jgi:hypothetical protein
VSRNSLCDRPISNDDFGWNGIWNRNVEHRPKQANTCFVIHDDINTWRKRADVPPRPISVDGNRVSIETGPKHRALNDDEFTATGCGSDLSCGLIDNQEERRLPSIDAMEVGGKKPVVALEVSEGCRSIETIAKTGELRLDVIDNRVAVNFDFNDPPLVESRGE